MPGERRLIPPIIMTIRKVWIEEGCISCGLCEDTASEIFQVPGGSTSRTRKGHQKLLTGDQELDERIREAAEGCPVEVIHVEES